MDDIEYTYIGRAAKLRRERTALGEEPGDVSLVEHVRTLSETLEALLRALDSAITE